MTPAEILSGARAEFERYITDHGEYPQMAERLSSGDYAFLQTSSDWVTWSAAVQWAVEQMALERQSAAPAQGTVRVRIACGVKPNGSWYAAGADNMPDPMSVAAVMAGSQGRTHWITADLPLPAAQEIAGRVEGA